MRFTVIWEQAALEQLAQLWNEAPDREAIARASDEIDAILATDPGNAGESRNEGRRLLFHGPMVAVFRVLELDRRVNVIAVAKSTRRH